MKIHEDLTRPDGDDLGPANAFSCFSGTVLYRTLDNKKTSHWLVKCDFRPCKLFRFIVGVLDKLEGIMKPN